MQIPTASEKKPPNRGIKVTENSEQTKNEDVMFN